MPLVAQAPKLWPALPLKRISMVPFGSPFAPYRRAISPASRAPTVRWAFWIV